jgi:hypothetical protein
VRVYPLWPQLCLLHAEAQIRSLAAPPQFLPPPTGSTFELTIASFELALA